MFYILSLFSTTFLHYTYLTSIGFELSVSHESLLYILKNVFPRSKFVIQILEKLPGNGYRNDTATSQLLEYRLLCEVIE